MISNVPKPAWRVRVQPTNGRLLRWTQADVGVIIGDLYNRQQPDAAAPAAIRSPNARRGLPSQTSFLPHEPTPQAAGQRALAHMRVRVASAAPNKPQLLLEELVAEDVQHAAELFYRTLQVVRELAEDLADASVVTPFGHGGDSFRGLFRALGLEDVGTSQPPLHSVLERLDGAVLPYAVGGARAGRGPSQRLRCDTI
jgi:hypothetical protein